MALGESYPSRVVHESHPSERFLVSRVRAYASDGNLREVGRERWRRVLAAFGVVEAKVGWAGKPPVGPLQPPLTAKEAQGYADKGWERWVPVAKVLHRLEAKRKHISPPKKSAPDLLEAVE